ncbi:MAG: GntR family transcriptional regulator [Verrucomicrobiales bacterium]|nr:GntR family transcriptional regulator [Verrucomicrobiales bacterium]
MSHSQSSTLAAAAEDRLRREIFDGQLPPGTRLAEAAEARRLGVSRVPVREAFAALERDGLLEFTETGRTVVKKLTPQDFEELFALRLLLEPSAARAAFPLSQKHRLLLEENLSATRNAKTLDEVTRLDLEFHQLIVAASGNARLLKLWRSLRSELELWLGYLHRQHRDQDLNTRVGTAGSHEEILLCFQTRSAPACEKLMREHILGWREWLPLSDENPSK